MEDSDEELQLIDEVALLASWLPLRRKFISASFSRCKSETFGEVIEAMVLQKRAEIKIIGRPIIFIFPNTDAVSLSLLLSC
jgi:hypothetical protein